MAAAGPAVDSKQYFINEAKKAAADAKAKFDDLDAKFGTLAGSAVAKATKNYIDAKTANEEAKKADDAAQAASANLAATTEEQAFQWALAAVRQRTIALEKIAAAYSEQVSAFPAPAAVAAPAPAPITTPQEHLKALQKDVQDAEENLKDFLALYDPATIKAVADKKKAEEEQKKKQKILADMSTRRAKYYALLPPLEAKRTMERIGSYHDQLKKTYQGISPAALRGQLQRVARFPSDLPDIQQEDEKAFNDFDTGLNTEWKNFLAGLEVTWPTAAENDPGYKDQYARTQVQIAEKSPFSRINISRSGDVRPDDNEDVTSTTIYSWWISKEKDAFLTKVRNLQDRYSKTLQQNRTNYAKSHGLGGHQTTLESLSSQHRRLYRAMDSIGALDAGAIQHAGIDPDIKLEERAQTKVTAAVGAYASLPKLPRRPDQMGGWFDETSPEDYGVLVDSKATVRVGLYKTKYGNVALSVKMMDPEDKDRFFWDAKAVAMYGNGIKGSYHLYDRVSFFDSSQARHQRQMFAAFLSTAPDSTVKLTLPDCGTKHREIFKVWNDSLEKGSQTPTADVFLWAHQDLKDEEKNRYQKWVIKSFQDINSPELKVEAMANFIVKVSAELKGKEEAVPPTITSAQSRQYMTDWLSKLCKTTPEFAANVILHMRRELYNTALAFQQEAKNNPLDPVRLTQMQNRSDQLTRALGFYGDAGVNKEAKAYNDVVHDAAAQAEITRLITPKASARTPDDERVIKAAGLH